MFHAVTPAGSAIAGIVKIHPEQFPPHHPDTFLIYRRRRRFAVQRPDDGIQLIQAQVRNKDQKVRQEVAAGAAGAALRNVRERIAEQRTGGGQDKAVHAARPVRAAHERVRKCRARVQIRQLFDEDGPTDVDDAAFLRAVAVVVGRAAAVAAVPAGGEVGWVFFSSGRFQSGRFIVPADEQSL